jgi:hypothetical protein
MRIKLFLRLGCFFSLWVGPAVGMTVGEWQGYSEDYRLGFVTGIADEVMNVQHQGLNDAKMIAGFRNCLKGQLPSTVLKVMNSYLDRHPAAYTEAPSGVVVSALLEMCDLNLRQAQKNSYRLKSRQASDRSDGK